MTNSFDISARDLCFLLGKASRLITIIYDRILHKECGISYALISFLAEVSPEKNITSLGTDCGIDRTTANRHLLVLMRLGYLCGADGNGDKRMKFYKITDKGSDLLKKSVVHVEKAKLIVSQVAFEFEEDEKQFRKNIQAFCYRLRSKELINLDMEASEPGPQEVL